MKRMLGLLIMAGLIGAVVFRELPEVKRYYKSATM